MVRIISLVTKRKKWSLRRLGNQYISILHLPEKGFLPTLIGLAMIGSGFTHQILEIQLSSSSSPGLEQFLLVGYLLITEEAFPP